MLNVLKIRAWLFPLFTADMRICYLTTFYLVAVGIAPANQSGFVPLARLLLSIALYGAWGVLLNDYMDLDLDRAAGKRTGLDQVPVWQIKALFIILPVVGFLLIPRPLSNPLVLGLFGACYLLALFYSAPKGLRLKEKGAWGFFADVILEKPLPSLILFAYFQHIGTDAIILAAFYSSIGGFTLAIHQIWDYESDMAHGMRTFGVSIGKERLLRLYNRVFVPFFFVCEACVLALLIYNVRQTGLILAAIFTFTGVILVYLVRRGIVIRDDPNRRGISAEVWFFFTFSEGPLPTVLGLVVTIQAPIFFPVLSALLVSQFYLLLNQYRWTIEKVVIAFRG